MLDLLELTEENEFPSNNHNLEVSVKAIYNIVIMAETQSKTWRTVTVPL